MATTRLYHCSLYTLNAYLEHVKLRRCVRFGPNGHIVLIVAQIPDLRSQIVSISSQALSIGLEFENLTKKCQGRGLQRHLAA